VIGVPFARTVLINRDFARKSNEILYSCARPGHDGQQSHAL
jgi:hypothetical protein